MHSVSSKEMHEPLTSPKIITQDSSEAAADETHDSGYLATCSMNSTPTEACLQRLHDELPAASAVRIHNGRGAGGALPECLAHQARLRANTPPCQGIMRKDREAGTTSGMHVEVRLLVT